MKRYLRFRNSSLRVLRAGFNGNDVIVNAIRRGNRNIRFARLFPPFFSFFFLRRPRETLLSRSMSLSRSNERAEMRKKRAWMDGGARVLRRQGCEATSLRFTRYGSGKCRER